MELEGASQGGLKGGLRRGFKGGLRRGFPFSKGVSSLFKPPLRRGSVSEGLQGDLTRENLRGSLKPLLKTSKTSCFSTISRKNCCVACGFLLFVCAEARRFTCIICFHRFQPP